MSLSRPSGRLQSAPSLCGAAAVAAAALATISRSSGRCNTSVCMCSAVITLAATKALELQLV